MRTQRRAFSLVEVLLASAILIAVLVPLIGLLTSRRTDDQSEEGMSEAVTLAENLMEKLLSPAVPFEAIDPGGGSGSLVKGGPGGTFQQAAFRISKRDAFDKDRLDLLEGSFWDGEEAIPGEAGGTYHVKTVGEKAFYVTFFAGKYPARDPITDAEPDTTRADVENELTFGFVENPAGNGEPFNFQQADRLEFDHQVIIKRAKTKLGPEELDTLPYLLKPYAVTRGANPVAKALAVTTPYFFKDRSKMLPPDMPTATLLTGWQDPRQADAAITLDLAAPEPRRKWAETTAKVVKRQTAPTLGYHPRVLGQKSFGLKRGGLMKLVIGIRFAPYQFSKLRSGDISREFWLVSFKADLEN